MIKITAYLRNEEDLRLWKEIPNKAEWLQKALHKNDIKFKPKDSSIDLGKPSTLPSNLTYKPTTNWGA